MTTAATARENQKSSLNDMPLPPAPFLSSVMQIEPIAVPSRIGVR